MELALETFAYAGCEGLARVDFFVDGERVLVNELNTMPGFTPTSVYAKLMEASGIGYPELVDRLCRLAIERHERQALAQLKQRDFGDRRELHAGRQRGDPDEVVAVARSIERERDVGAVADVGVCPDRAAPAARGQRGRVAVGQGEVDVVGDVDLRGEAGGGRLDFDLLCRRRWGRRRRTGRRRRRRPS